MNFKMRSLLTINRLIHLVYGLVALGLFAHNASGKEVPVILWPRPSSHSTNSFPSDEQIKKEMKKYLGVRYRSGGSTKKGMDCSGFVRRVYENIFGVDLPHNASGQYSLPIFQLVSREGLKTGDLIFFSFSKKSKRITHVGIYLSDSLFMHAGQKSGVIASRLEDPYWKQKIVASKRLARDEVGASTEAFPSMAGFEFSPDEKSAFRLQYAAIEYRPFELKEELYVLADLPVNRAHAFEIQYSKELWDDLWSLRLSAFRVELPGSAVIKEHYPFLAGPGSSMFNEDFDSAYFDGIRIACDISPIHWLRITPSLTYFHYGPGVDDHDLPKRSLGLKVQLGTLDTGSSLSTSFQYYDQRYLTARFFNSTGEWNALDMSFTFRHQLTDHLQFSLIGQRVLKAITGLEDASKAEKQIDQSLFFTLDFTY